MRDTEMLDPKMPDIKTPFQTTSASLGLVILAVVATLFAGCMGSDDDGSFAGSDSAAPNTSNNSTGVGQSGAQDFGRFRGLIRDGQIPAPSTLDAVGFFNEHKFELPPADCGQDICMHGMFGVQGNMINGSNCTTVAIGVNTPLHPDDFERPPLNLALAIDVSGSMQGGPLQAVREGLLMLADELGPKDEVTLIAYSTSARVVFRSTPEDDLSREQLKEEIRDLSLGGSTNIHEGLSLAAEKVQEHRAEDRQNRVILLSDGMATAGITNADRIINLAAAHADTGIGLTTIGVGDEFDLRLMREISEVGSGNFYFLENAAAVEEVFVEEVNTFLVPIAEDITIDFAGDEAYQFRAAYGTRQWSGTGTEARIEIPAMFLASRQSIDDIGPGEGRRGGGGIILLELIPTTDEDILANTPAGSLVGDLMLDYRRPRTERFFQQQVELTNPLAPGQTPAIGEFENFTVEKGFVALNIYTGFKMATERVEHGAANSALNILQPLADNVAGWLNAQEERDEDIEADLELMRMLIANIQERGAQEEAGAPPNPWPSD